MSDREDDDECAVWSFAEVLEQQRLRTLGLRPRNGERRREERRELRRGEHSGAEHHEPAGEDDDSEAHDGGGPALKHGSTLLRSP
jgi:hypothetical protein